jgi:carbon monoxide dehydrogenase subunit G
MTVRVERTVDLSVPLEEVWDFISDPENRAKPISVVTDFTVDGPESATWHIKLPIPVLDRTITVETREEEVTPREYVKFVGKSSVLRVVGEHELEPTDDGTRLTSRFIVDGRLPGVERFFKRNMDRELDNLEQALREYAASDGGDE